MRVLAGKLERAGYQTKSVNYHFLRRSPAENAATLFAGIANINTPIVHWVGHSLGGIVILHLFEEYSVLPPGRVVLLGSPVQGSDLARRLHERVLLRPLLGRSIEKGLLGGAPSGAGGRQLGIITGTRRLGLGALMFAPGEQNDGVVAENETAVSGEMDRVSVPVSHSMMIFSKCCARLVLRFLGTGRFTLNYNSAESKPVLTRGKYGRTQ